MCEKQSARLVVAACLVGLLFLARMPAWAEEPEVQLLRYRPAEVAFLTKNIPESYFAVSSGVLVAGGEVLRGEKLIAVSIDQIWVNDIQVYPLGNKRPQFRLQHETDRLDAAIYLESRRTGRPAIEIADHILQSAQQRGLIDSYQSVVGKSSVKRYFEIFVGGQKSFIAPQLPPVQLAARVNQILDSVILEYYRRVEIDKQIGAQDWLRKRLQDLQAIGDVTGFSFLPSGEVSISGPYGWGQTFPPNYPRFDDGRTFAEVWNSTRKSTVDAARTLVDKLEKDMVVVRAGGFEVSCSPDPELSRAVTGIQEGQLRKDDIATVQRHLGLTDAQTKTLVGELR